MAPAAAGGGGIWADPLGVSYPSPFIFVQYPLFATNIKVLCDKDAAKKRGQWTFTATLQSIRRSYESEGLLGLYRDLHWYSLHQAARDVLRLVAGRCVCPLLGLPAPRPVAASDDGEQQMAQQEKFTSRSYRARMLTKYLIDATVYPIMLISTRGIALFGDGLSVLERVRLWCRLEGVLSMYNGLTASLFATALDDAADYGLSTVLESAGVSRQMDAADKLLLKACSASFVSVVTSSISYVSVLQRCQSTCPGLPEPRPLASTIRGLPWWSTLWQLVMFGGILALNVKLVMWKVEMQAEDSEGEDAE